MKGRSIAVWIALALCASPAFAQEPGAQEPGAESSAAEDSAAENTAVEDAVVEDTAVEDTAAQDPLPEFVPPPRGDEGGWEPLDGIASATDEHIITFLDIERIYAREARDRPITTEEEFYALRRDIVVALERRDLQQVAGRSLELSDADLEARLRDWIREQREPLGTVGYGDSLRRVGRDPLTELPRARQEMLGTLWTWRATGDPRGFGRPVVDTYVRPGELRSQYEPFVEAVSSDRVEFSILTVLGASVGGVDAARDVAADLRDQILAGQVEFAEVASQLNIEQANPAGGGRFAPLPLVELSRTVLGDFLRDAREGEISEPQPFGPLGREVRPGIEIRGYRLVRLERRDAGPPPPPFEDADLQRDLRERIQAIERERRLQLALDAVDARVWRWRNPALDRLFR